MTRRSTIHSYPWSLLLGILLVSPAFAADLTAPITAPVIEPAPGAFVLSTTYTGELWRNNGGIKTGTDYMQGLDASLSVDANKLFGLQGAQFYFEGFYVNGKSLELNYIGAVMPPSAPGRLFEPEYSQALSGILRAEFWPNKLLAREIRCTAAVWYNTSYGSV